MSLNTHDYRGGWRSGTGVGILTSSFVSIVLVLIIFEQLGLPPRTIGQLVVALPVAGWVMLGLVLRTTRQEEFFVAGQRASAVFNGFAMAAAVASGGALSVLLAGLTFAGIDAMAVALGWLTGLVFAGLVILPYLRKAGAASLPGFLSLRFGSRLVRLVAALCLLPPLVMLIAAELRIGAAIAAPIVGLDIPTLVRVGAVLIALSVLFGGARALSWVTTVQFIIMMIGLTVPLAAMSLIETNLPLPQLTYGGLIEQLNQLEPSRGMLGGDTVAPGAMLPGAGAPSLGRPFAQAFGTLSPVDFVALALTIMLGVAALPALAVRASASGSVTVARRSVGWAIVLVLFLALTIPAYAVFLKAAIARDIIGATPDQWPEWGRRLVEFGVLAEPTRNTRLGLERDTLALALPVIAGLPMAIVGMAAAAIVAAVSAAAGSHLVAIGSSLSTDLYAALLHRTASPARRLLVARLGIAVAALAAATLALTPGIDAMRLLLWALSLLAGLTPLLVLAVWWRRLTMLGTTAGVLAGCGVAALIILGSASGDPVAGFDGLTAGLPAACVALLTAFVVSVVTPAPDQRIDELVEKLRVPGGETLYARLMRAAARGRAPRP